MTARHVLSRSEALAQLTAAGQPYELETKPHYGEPCRIFKNAPESLRALYEAARSDETFIVYQDERLSFEETWQQAARIATLLAQNAKLPRVDPGFYGAEIVSCCPSSYAPQRRGLLNTKGGSL